MKVVPQSSVLGVSSFAVAFSGPIKCLSINLLLLPASACKSTSLSQSQCTKRNISFLSQLGFIRRYGMVVSASDQMDLIKQLRERTSAPIKDVRAALVDSNGDIEVAHKELRKREKVLASKKSSQTAAEGLLALAQSHTKTAIIELNCETDFVARNENFQHLALSLAKRALLVENSSQQVSGAFHVVRESLEEMTLNIEHPKISGETTVHNASTEVVAMMGKNVRLRRGYVMPASSQGLISTYLCTSRQPRAISPFTSKLKAPTSYGFTRQFNTLPPHKVSDIIALFTAKPSSPPKEDLIKKVAILRNELVQEASDSVRVLKILKENSDFLIPSHPSGSALLELLKQLDSWPSLALEVINWRRKRSGAGNPMNVYEYSKGIKAAGRCRNIDLAVQLFKEAAEKGIKTTSTYNALMGAFMFNGLADRCQSLFCDMKRDATCTPSIVTYNILISVFGRLMLVDHMEATFQEINKLELSLNVSTYNHLIAGYIAAWMWDDMEKVFQMLKSGLVKPNLKTYLLMLRGYAHSGNLEKMEETYLLVRDHVNENEIPLIRSMICAYCKSSEADRIKKIEVLLTLIPEEEYRPWLNVLLIKLYAQEDWLEEMENAINEAFEHRIAVTTTGIIRCIIATYFRCSAVEELAIFVRRAECAGWRICRSLYHCKLVMYGSQKRFEEMRNVLNEMKGVNLDCTGKTFWIMYKAYLSCGQRSMVLKILGQMFKLGYEVPLNAFPS